MTDTESYSTSAKRRKHKARKFVVFRKNGRTCGGRSRPARENNEEKEVRLGNLTRPLNSCYKEGERMEQKRPICPRSRVTLNSSFEGGKKRQGGNGERGLLPRSSHECNRRNPKCKEGECRRKGSILHREPVRAGERALK